MSESKKLAYSPKEACEAMGISRASYYRLLRAGEIETFKWFGKRYVRADVLRNFINAKSGRVDS